MSLDKAKQDLELSHNRDYPKGLTVTAWWQERQRKSYAVSLAFRTVEEAMQTAQVGNTSGFDHREFHLGQAGRTVHFKLAELRVRFPDFDIADFPELRESAYSVPESVVAVDGRPLSSIFLTHLYFYLRTIGIKRREGFRRILEIGSGYGGLARIYKTMEAGLTYILTDLPESLFYAQAFLRANFPNARTYYVHDTLPPDGVDAYDFVFVPAQSCELLRGMTTDLVINTGSLQEMSVASAHFWMTFIQHTIDTKLFYSWNYFLNAKEYLAETKTDYNPLVPILDAFWHTRYFRINDPVITLDCSQRNWLEVCVERMPREQHATLDLLKYTNELVDKANAFPTATNPWFENIWMAIWCNPAPGIITAMLKGIDFFREGQAFGITNHLTVEDFDEAHFYRMLRDTFSEDITA